MVSLVGAGPGDAGLITVKAVERLKTADIVFYDRLANVELLKYCKNEAELFFVGKAAAHHYVKQEDTIKMMIDAAKQGKSVVRLKGGDPLIFGRGSEEAIALRQAGVEFEFIPGVTSGIAAATYAGIPLTHRNLVTKCVFITAHEEPGKATSQNDWSEIAKMENTTIVIYMGVGNAPEIADILVREGMDPDMPVAIIENGTFNSQRTFLTNLQSVAETISSNSVKPPAIFVIGPTVAMKNELDWFEQKPLFGVRVAATRAADQIRSLSDELKELGAEVIPFSVIETVLSVPKRKISEILSEKHYDWLIFTSENGVRYFFELLEMEKSDARALAGIKIAAIGKGTAAKLRQYNLIADFMPQKYTSESLLQEFPERENLANLTVLRVKGDFSNDLLVEGLRKLKANVTTVEVYKIFKGSPSETTIKTLVEEGCDAVTFTSQSTVNNFYEILGQDRADRILKRAVPFVIGPVTAEALREKNIGNMIIAEEHTIDGLVTEIVKHFNG